MSEHKATITWTRKTSDFVYETYDRTHTIHFPGGQSLNASAAPAFSGKAEYANPEEMFIAALSSCHMLTFLAFASKARLTVDRYEDQPSAILEKNAQGRLAVTKVILRPSVTWGGIEKPDAEKLKGLHEKSHAHCMIGLSINSEFQLEIRN